MKQLKLKEGKIKKERKSEDNERGILKDIFLVGIFLQMDGFVLPPFESTCMLKDKDVIRSVKHELYVLFFILLT